MSRAPCDASCIACLWLPMAPCRDGTSAFEQGVLVYL